MRSGFYKSDYFIYSVAAGLSLLLSFYLVARESVINPDAICYLYSAEAMNRIGITGAMHLCGQAQWPFYSWLIYEWVKFTHLSYMQVAYLLDACFSLLSVVMFIQVVKALGGSKRVLWLAAGVILLSHTFNVSRVYIIRDHGFWAFYLASVFMLLSFFKTPTWKTAFAWLACMLTAALFRLEGAIFLLLLPFLCFFDRRYAIKNRFSYFCKLILPVFAIGLGCAIYLFAVQTVPGLKHAGASPATSAGQALKIIPTDTSESLYQWGRLPELMEQFHRGFFLFCERFQAAKSALSHFVLNNDSVREASLVLSILLMVWYLVRVMSNLSWIYAFLVMCAWKLKIPRLSYASKLVLMAYLAINIAVTFVFLVERFFLSKRYLVALSLVLMLWIPFVLEELIKKRRYLLLSMSFFFIFISSLGGFFNFAYSKTYIADAGTWLAVHLPKEVKLYVNDPQLMYYSHHFDENFFVAQEKFAAMNLGGGGWKQFDYIALRVDKKNVNENLRLASIKDLTPQHVFSNKRGDAVMIFKVESGA